MKNGIPVAIGIAGRIGSGKTTIARSLAVATGWPCVSFGDYVRSVARLRGMDTERETLQRLGKSLIDSLGWQEFCAAVISQSGWKPGGSLIIDGVRHVESVPVLKGLVSPAAFYLLYVDVHGVELERRLYLRNNERRDLAELETDYTESQVREMLYREADLVVDGTTDVEKLVNTVLRWIQTENTNGRKDGR